MMEARGGELVPSLEEMEEEEGCLREGSGH